MASTHKHLRSSTANKRPTTAIADGQIALNTNTTSPGLFFKDSTGATIIKVGPVHVGSSAPNASPPAGGSSGNSTGEIWLDTSLTPNGVKIWNGASWTNVTPIGSTTVQGLLELATNAETQTGTDPDRAVTPAGLQSKVSDSTSTTSSTTIASSTAVKSAYDLANAALPKTGGTVTGNLEIGTTGSLSFEGATADAFETTIAVVDPTADRTITLPDTTGTVVTTGDTGTVTSTMIADGTIVNGDINASAAIAHSKLANITAGSVLLGNASNVPTATALSGDVTVNSTGVTAISSGVIINADVNASAAIAGTKISPDFGSQNVTTTGTVTGASLIPTSSTVPTNGVYLPAANSVAISTGGSGRLFVDSSGRVGVGTNSPQGKLIVSNGGANGIEFFPDTDSGVNSTINSFNRTSSTFSSLSINAAQHLFLTSSTERLRITSTGALNFVGAGTAGSTQAVSFNGSAPVNSLVIDSSGRLGVGTSSPTSLLALTHTASTAYSQNTEGLTLRGVSGINNSFTSINFNGSGYGGNIANIAAVTIDAGTSYSNSAGGLRFATKNTSDATPVDRLSITPAGLVGIGTTAPGAILDVAPDANRNLQVLGKSGTTYGLELKNGSANTGGEFHITAASAGGVVFNRGTTESARIDSSGRLLVGTSSALTGGDTQYSKLVLQGNTAGATGPAFLAIARGETAATTASAGQTIGRIVFSDSAAGQYATIGCETDAAVGNNDYPSRLVFSVTSDGASSPAIAGRFDSSGQFSVYGRAGVNTGSIGFRNSSGTAYWANSTNQDTWYLFDADGSSYVYLNQNFSSWNFVSDKRLKENIVDLGYGINTVKQLKPRQFNFIGKNKTILGFVAQELQTVIPEAVSGIEQEFAVTDTPEERAAKTLGVSQDTLIPVLVKALQEAVERIEQLEVEVAALKVQ